MKPVAELHPVITLLIKRMDSHPEEFVGLKAVRWTNFISKINTAATGENLAAVAEAYSNLRLNAIHEQVLDELLNGEERRAKEREQQTTLARNRTPNLNHILPAQQHLAAQTARNDLGDAQNAQNVLRSGLYTQNALQNPSEPTMVADEISVGGEKLAGAILRGIKSRFGLVVTTTNIL